MSPDTQKLTTLAAGGSAASRWWLVIKLAISLLFIIYLAINVEWTKVSASIRTASAAWLFISLFYIPAGMILVALRYHRLVNGLISFRAMLRLVIFQGAVSTFLANAAGSLSYIGVLIKVYKIPAELAIQSTIVARLVDMLASFIVVVVLTAAAWNKLAPIQPLVLLAMLLCAIVLILAIVAVLVVRRWKMPGAFATLSGQGDSSSFWERVLGFGLKVIQLKPDYIASTLPSTLTYSLVMQAVIAVGMYFGVRAFHLDIGLFEAALVGVVASFLASVPITLFGGLGVYEVSTVGLLAVFGVPIEAGTGMILVVRTMFFLVMAMAFVVVRPPSQ